MRKLYNFFGTLIIVLVGISIISFFALYGNGYSGLRVYHKAKENQIRVACVGDSITYGHGVPFWFANNYPTKLQDMLGDDYCVNNYGVSAYCVQDDSSKPYMSLDVYKDSLEFNPDIVILMLGTNDAKPYNWKGIDEFKDDYDKLINSYKSVNPNVEIYLATLCTAFDDDPLTVESSFDIMPSIVDEISIFISDYASENNYYLIDINSLTKDRKDLILPDLIHPNEFGAFAIANEIYQNLIK